MKQKCVFVLIAILFLTSCCYASGPVRITFLNPDGKGNTFWDLQVSFMRAAAEDLGIDLTVIYSPGSNRFEYFRLAENILMSENKPDYFISIFKKGISEKILEISEEQGVNYFTINTDIPDEKRKKIGGPRGKYTHWIGQMIPDDVSAGYNLANILIRKAKSLNLKNSKYKIEAIGLTGARDSSAAIFRNKGLNKAIKQQRDVLLEQIVFVNWDKNEAYKRLKNLFSRYPGLNLIWCASDGISLGAVKAIEERGKLAGKQIITGGIDWSKEGLASVEEGKMTASLGGHFIEGGLALVLLYDYYHGIDFASDPGTIIHTPFCSITSDDYSQKMKKIKDRNWDYIDFKKLSKVYQHNIKKYDFALKSILNQ